MKKVRSSYRIIAFLLAFVMIAGLLPLEGALRAFAASSNFYVRSNSGDVWYYSNVNDAWNKVNSIHGTMGLLNDVNIKNRLNVWKNRSIEIELNGHVLNRGLSSWEKDGEVIELEKGSTLKVYGGTKNDPAANRSTRHTCKAYSYGNRENMNFSGGLITGGYSYNTAGGVKMCENSRLELYYTTVAGNRADTTGWHPIDSFGYGGGVHMSGENGILELHNSSISNNFADKSGGGIYTSATNCRIYLYDSHVDGNYGDNHGGGVYLNGYKNTLTINKSTISGNRADDRNGGGVYSDAESCKIYMDQGKINNNFANWNGGGIYINGRFTSISMDSGTVNGNVADDDDGGGIYVNAQRCTIEMKKSKIDGNKANDNGAGIYVNADYFKLQGDAKQIMEPEKVNDWNAYIYGSVISYNYIDDSDNDGGGGGIFLDNDYATIKGINFLKNRADGSGSGGALYLDDESICISDCNIVNNIADDYGGGICNKNDFNTIENCTVYNNESRESDGAGGGIYCNNLNNIQFSGTCVVRGNRSKSYAADNVYLSGWGTSATNAYIIPALTKGADFHVRTSKYHANDISTTGTFRDSYYTYDNDSGKHIEWDPEDRTLKIKAGKKQTVSVSTFVPDSGKTTQKVSGGYTVNGKNYELLRGVADIPGTESETEDLQGVFYYSDGYFMGNTKDYNYHLATMSMYLACVAGYSRVEGSSQEQITYIDKSNNFRQMMSDIGVKDKDIYINDYNVQKPGTFTIGVALAKKDLPDGNTLVVIGVRGIGYEAEWVSNMTLGTEGEAKGFASAATQVFAELRDYLDRNGIDGSSESTKFWITGFSRAGATANLTAKRIVDTYDNHGTHTYAYPMEPPKGGLESEKVAGNDYNCIHNTINNNDLVPWVGPGEMGFIRYGADHFIPGSYTWTAANDAWAVNSKEYKAQRDKMKKQLKAVDSEMPFDDYFHSATIDYIGSMVFSQLGWQRVGETILNKWTAEEFIPLFFKKFQHYSFSFSDSYRKAYSGVKISGDRSFEQAGGTLAGLLFSKSPEELSGLAGCFSDLMNRLGTGDMIKLYEGIRQHNTSFLSYLDSRIAIEEYFHKVMGDTFWAELRTTIWNKLTTLDDKDRACGYHIINEYLTEEEVAELGACFDSLMIPIIDLLTWDYEKYDQDLLGTMVYNVGNLLSNHYPEVVTAWLRSYDSFYDNETSPVVMKSSVRTAPSDVSVIATAADGTQTRYDSADQVISVYPDTKISFIPSAAKDADKGEGIYYAFTSGSSDDKAWHPYNYSFFLDSSRETSGKVTIKTLAAHYDQRTAEKTFTFALMGNASYYYPSRTSNNGVDYNSKSMKYLDSYEINVNFEESGNKKYSFNNWNVYFCTDSGTKRNKLTPDQYYEYLGEGFDAYSPICTVVNKTGQSFCFEPVFSSLISGFRFEFDSAKSYHIPAVVDNGENGNYEVPVAWYFDSAQDKYIGQFTETMSEDTALEEIDKLNVNWNLQKTNDYRRRRGWGEFYINNPVIQYTAVSGKDVTIEAAFDYDSGCGRGRLLNERRVTLIAVDENTNQEMQRYYFFSNSVSSSSIDVRPPAIKDMQFTRWDDNSTSTKQRTYTQGDYVKVYYRPVVNSVKVTLDKNITPAEEMPVLDSATATISNEWRIDNAELQWTNDAATADFDTVYTAHIHVDTTNLYATNLSVEGAPSMKLTGAFVFADKVRVDVNAKDGSELQLISCYFTNDPDGQVYLDITFAATPKEKLVSVNDVQITVPYGSKQDDILSAMPAEVTAITETGKAVQVGAVWTRADAPDRETIEMQTVSAYGTLSSDVYDASGIPEITAAATVDGAPKTEAPTASLAPGTYEGKQDISLVAADDSEIYYTCLSFDVGTYTEEVVTETAVYDLNGNQKFNEDGTPVTEKVVSYRDTYYPESFDDMQFTKMDTRVTVDSIDKDNYIIAYASRKGYHNSDYVILKYTLTPNKEYDLTVEGGSGSGRYLSGTEVTITPQYPDEDSILDRWTSSNEKLVVSDDDISATFPMPVGDTTVTAEFARGHYITLVTGLADIPDQVIKVPSVLSEDGQTYIDPPVDEIEGPPNDEGEFMGWFVNESRSIKYDFSKPVTKHLTLYARWSNVDYDYRDTYGLSLDDSVDIRIQIDVRAYLGDELSGNEKIVITHADPTVQTPTFIKDEILLKDAELTDGLFITEVTPAIAQIAEPVTVELLDSEGNPLTLSNGKTSFVFSAEGYCRSIIEYSDYYNDETVELARSIINYGRASYDYFSYTGQALGEGFEKPEADADSIPDVDVMTPGTKIENVVSTSFRAISRTELRLYVSGSPEAVSVSKAEISGEDVTEDVKMDKTDDGRYFIRVSSIYPADLDKTITITLSDGTMMNYSAANYIKSTLKSQTTSESLRNLSNALYYYNAAAKAYVNKTQEG